RADPGGEGLGSGARFAVVLGGGGMGLADGGGGALPRLEHTRSDLPPDGIDLLFDVDHDVVISFVVPPGSARRRSRLPRASSVASASRCGVQKRRKRPSHASTSRSGPESTAYKRRVPSGRTVAKPASRS